MGDLFKKNYKILFQGDSITFSNRVMFLKNNLGNGYCYLIDKYIEENYPKLNIDTINKGVYGDTTKRLKHRWKRDCLSMSPDLLSLLIGINDTWRRYDRGKVTTEKEFFNNYNYLLQSIIKKNPKIQVVIMSPFLIPLDKKQEKWLEDLMPKIRIAEELANKYNAIYIPLMDIFQNEILHIDKEELTKDGVHLTLKGHEIIAKAWIKALDI